MANMFFYSYQTPVRHRARLVNPGAVGDAPATFEIEPQGVNVWCADDHLDIKLAPEWSIILENGCDILGFCCALQYWLSSGCCN